MRIYDSAFVTKTLTGKVKHVLRVGYKRLCKYKFIIKLSFTESTGQTEESMRVGQRLMRVIKIVINGFHLEFYNVI